MRIVARAAVVLAASLLNACGSSSTKTTTVTVSSSTAPASTTSSTSALTSHAATSGIPRCRAAMLTLSFLGQQGATGHGVLGFSLRNVSSSSCHTFGYPGILFLARDGIPLTTSSTRTTRDFFGRTSTKRLVLAPGASASFRVGVTHGISSSVGCATAYGIQVIPPDDTVALRTRMPGGAFQCRTATVSPMMSGRSAYP
jgi:Protein of unknown function (DUF4232)